MQLWNYAALAPWKENYDKPRLYIKKQRLHFANKGPYCQGYGFSSSHLCMWALDHKEGRTPKNWCLQTVELEKTPESPLDCKEIKPVNLKGDQPWIVIGMTEAEAEAPSDVNRWLIGKVPDAGKDWGQKGKDIWMSGWHHQCNGHELGQILGDGEGQGDLACCIMRVAKTSMNGWLNNNQVANLHCRV